MTASPVPSTSPPSVSIPEFTRRHKFDDGDYSLVPHDYALTNTIPFTYRDGFTYLQVIEELRRWVNEGLRNALNTSLESLAADYNTRISRLLSDIRDEVGQYEGLPEQMKRRLNEAINEYRDDFDIFREMIREEIRREMHHDHVEVFNWLTGRRDTLDNFMRDLDNRILVNGLLAADFSRAGFTCKEWDSLPLTISELQTQGKIFVDAYSREYIHSPISGRRMHVSLALSEVYEALSTGNEPISTMPLSAIATATIKDLQKRVCR